MTTQDFYTDDGCLVVISIPRVGATYDLFGDGRTAIKATKGWVMVIADPEAYAVAEKDHRTALHMMEEALPEDEPILAVTTMPAAVMRELKLRPKEHILWPEVLTTGAITAVSTYVP